MSSVDAILCMTCVAIVVTLYAERLAMRYAVRDLLTAICRLNSVSGCIFADSDDICSPENFLNDTGVQARWCRYEGHFRTALEELKAVYLRCKGMHCPDAELMAAAREAIDAGELIEARFRSVSL